MSSILQIVKSGPSCDSAKAVMDQICVSKNFKAAKQPNALKLDESARMKPVAE